MNTENHKYLCWLDQIRGLGRKRIFALLQAAGESSLFSRTDPVLDNAPDPADWGEAARLLFSAPETQLTFLCAEAFPSGKRAEQAARLILAARKEDPARIEEKLARTGIFFSCIIEESFPSRLRMIPDPPFGIYCRGPLLTPVRTGTRPCGLRKPDPEHPFPDGSLPGGSVPEGSLSEGSLSEGSAPEGSLSGNSRTPVSFPGIESPAAAVIGARLASGYGREQARRFSYRMASRGITIISGMARGVDGIAQTAALDAGGRSYAVLGCGVDICYPEENRPLYDRLIQQGGILSEYAPGTPPEARLFPLRNRIISGLADAVLVIEARKRSGTLITVDMALEQGRDVFALPGRVSDSLSDGCNRLIRQGASPATCPEDLLEYFFETDSPAPEVHKRRPVAAAGDFLSGGIHGSEKETAKEKEKSAEQGCEDGCPSCLKKDDLTEGEREGGSCGGGAEDLRENHRESVLDSPGSHACPVLCAGRESLRPEPEKCRKGGCGGHSPLSCQYRQEARRLPAGGGLCLPETDGEEEPEKKPASLEELILGVLSPEDGMHLERILEQIASVPAKERAFSGTPGLSMVIPCLLRLKTDGRVEETSAGYFRKIR